LIANEEREFFQGIAQIFYQSHYNISTPLLGCGGCFDLVAKKDVFLLLVKLLINIDSLREEQAYELKKLALMLSASPLIIGKKIRKSNDIEDGVVYSRYDIPAISKDTLRNLLINHVPPLIYTHRGGYKVKVNGELLKEKRLEMGMSLNELARRVGVTKRAIYEYERGTSDISVDTAIRIEECLVDPLTL
jgi:putative transcriptional regulator